MNPYQSYISDFARVISSAKALPLGGGAPSPRPVVPSDAPRVLVFSPHPDDEVIMGALPLRLLRVPKWNVLNVAVTLGTHKARRPERWKELQACCDYIGFGLIRTAPDGLEGINPKARAGQPDQ